MPTSRGPGTIVKLSPAAMVPRSRTEKYQPHQVLCTISLAACAKPITALNLKQG